MTFPRKIGTLMILVAALASLGEIMEWSLPSLRWFFSFDADPNVVGEGPWFEHRGAIIGSQQMLVTGEGDRLDLEAGAAGARLLLLRGQPLREPVAHYGPFVMNTQREIEQALQDYRDGVFA